MSTYTKLTARNIKRRILNGEYVSWSGVTRAIGKTAGITGEERLQLRQAAMQFFKKEDAAPPRKQVFIKRVKVPLESLQLPMMILAIADDIQLSGVVLPILREAIRSKATLQSLVDSIEKAM